jgi:hypothetical protein
MKKLGSGFVFGLVGCVAAVVSAAVSTVVTVKNYKDRNNQTILHARVCAHQYAEETKKAKKETKAVSAKKPA